MLNNVSVSEKQYVIRNVFDSEERGMFKIIIRRCANKTDIQLK